jgi:deazaflavin-dependent oxidoreductase (nitroreductase family)
MAEDWNTKIIDEFRTNEGKVGGMFVDMPLLLLHTTGAKSGKDRTNPVMYMRDGDRYVVFASKGGAPTDPDWYYNVKANPDVTLEVGTESFPAHATALDSGPERDELFHRNAAAFPQFQEYQDGVERTIPVVVLERA